MSNIFTYPISNLPLFLLLASVKFMHSFDETYVSHKNLYKHIKQLLITAKCQYLAFQMVTVMS